jgi:hypothetical protein
LDDDARRNCVPLVFFSCLSYLRCGVIDADCCSVFFSSFLVKLLFLVFTSDFGLAIDEGENGTQMDFILLLLFFFCSFLVGSSKLSRHLRFHRHDCTPSLSILLFLFSGSYSGSLFFFAMLFFCLFILLVRR